MGKKIKWEMSRYCELQNMRKHGTLTKDTLAELQDMAMERLFAIIESDPDIKAIFKKLKDRISK